MYLEDDSPNREKFQQLAQHLDIASRVTFTDVVPDPLASGIYDTADIVCQVSRWEEASGYVITEAMVSQNPVIGTRVGEIRKLINNGEFGFFIDRRDIDSMANKIMLLVDNESIRAKMGSVGGGISAGKFNHRVKIAEQIGHYDVVFGRSSNHDDQIESQATLRDPRHRDVNA